MQKLIFLFPLYNDWESLNKLLQNINIQLEEINSICEVIVVDDNSTIPPSIDIKKLNNIIELKVLRLKENLGSQKAISLGLKHIEDQKDSAIITIMDSDGEDDFSKIPEMINSAKENGDKIVVSCRTKRQEGIFFSLLYSIHKLFIFLFSGHWINFGNYSSFNSMNLKKILSNNYSWLAFSSSIAKNCKIKKLYADRQKRICGESNLSFFGLFQHSFRVLSVFQKEVSIISLLYFIIFFIFNKFTSLLFLSLILTIITILINVLILFTKKTYLNDNLKNDFVHKVEIFK